MEKINVKTIIMIIFQMVYSPYMPIPYFTFFTWI